MDEIYILAREVLLDALGALGPHREAMILVGAQALYLHSREDEFAVAPFTTDGDLAIDTTLLTEFPPLETLLEQAGFSHRRQDSVGEWVTDRKTHAGGNAEVAVDFLVPVQSEKDRGRRSARLKGHHSRFARLVEELQGAMMDNELMVLGSLQKPGSRSFPIRVAGPAALIMAKSFKIQDRLGSLRLRDKDALDIFRLLRVSPVGELARKFNQLLCHRKVVESCRESLEIFGNLFQDSRSQGVEMVVRSLGFLADRDEVTQSCVSLAEEFLKAVKK